MVSLNDFIDPDLSSNDVIHSSGYVSSDGTGGGGGGLSLDKRRQLNHQDRIVASYHHSQLGRRYGAVKARTADQSGIRAYDANKDSFESNAKFGNRQRNNVKDANKIDPSIAKRQHFIEPPTRKYNPYG